MEAGRVYPDARTELIKSAPNLTASSAFGARALFEMLLEPFNLKTAVDLVL